MNDNEINIEGVTMKLPSQFFVIATQNPLDQVGTSPLPESQLDRFLMRISLGKPNRKAEKEILKGENKTPSAIKQIMSKDDLIFIQKELINKKVSNEIYEYILDLLSESRRLREGGLSTRAAIAVINASKACAYINGATDVTPDHVQYIFKSVAEHRLDNGYIDSSSLSDKIFMEWMQFVNQNKWFYRRFYKKSGRIILGFKIFISFQIFLDFIGSLPQLLYIFWELT